MIWMLLKNLEIVIQLVHSRNERIILCCEWNLNFMQDNISLQESTESIRGSRFIKYGKIPNKKYKVYLIFNRLYYIK